MEYIDIFPVILIIISLCLIWPKPYCDYYRLVVTKKKHSLHDFHDAMTKTIAPKIRKIRFNKKKNRWELLEHDRWKHYKVSNNDWVQEQAQYLSKGYEMLLIPYDVRQRIKENHLRGRALELPDINQQYVIALP